MNSTNSAQVNNAEELEEHSWSLFSYDNSHYYICFCYYYLSPTTPPLRSPFSRSVTEISIFLQLMGRYEGQILSRYFKMGPGSGGDPRCGMSA